MARVTVHLPDELDERIRRQLEYGDSYSAIVQDALNSHLDGDSDPAKSIGSEDH